ncbi:MAG: ABC transporter substrate-binding protein [Thaumarchaeota archaeon]|nr:ABC transporter substrate-binding protein [Nitrososphaerota archaeon]
MAASKLIRIVILIVFLLSFVTIPVIPTTHVRAQSQPSCPSNRQIGWTLNGGAPNSMTALTTAVFSGFVAGELEYWGAYPSEGPTGIQYYNESIVDWVKSNANYTQWTLNVKPGIRWSDGSLINATDILTTYSSQYAFNSSFDFTNVHSEVTKQYALNSSAAVFVLNKTDAHFPETISPIVFTSVIPASAARQGGSTYQGFGTPVVTGPFGAVNYQAGQTLMVMARNPYFNSTGLPEPQACQLNVNFVESDADAATLLQEGGTDLAVISPASVASVLKNPNVHIINEVDMQVTPATFNITTYPFNMTAFRQALAYSIDESAIAAQAFAGYADPAWSAQGIVPPLISNLYNPNQVKYSLNTTKALALLSSIGITKGSDGLLHYPNGGGVVTLSIWGDTEHAPDVVAAGVVATDLQAIGIQATTNIVARSSITSLTSVAPNTMYIVTGEAPIFASASVDALPGWDVYAHPAIPSTYWEYPASVNNEYNGNLSIITKSANLTVEAQALNNIEAINAANLPTLILCYPSQLWGYSTLHWTNWPVYPSGWIYLNNNVFAQAFAQLQPVTNSSGSTATVISTSVLTSAITVAPTTTVATSTVASVATSIVTVPVTTTVATSIVSTTGNGGGVSDTVFYAVIAVVVILLVAVAALFMSRSRQAPKK